MAAKRKAGAISAVPTAEDDRLDPSDQLSFLCLGGGNEVGRSCHVIQYKGKTVMLDAGQHPAYTGLAALPFFDDFEMSTVDVLLISHFHIDHAASLPYVLAKTNFRGRVFMTHPTKAIYKWLIQDSIRVSNTSSGGASQLAYSEQDHINTFPMIEAIDYHTTHTISSIRITPYPAGHVLGAAMYLIEIAGLTILFTGDYSREQDRHLVSAEVPRGVKVDVLITESTYGIASHVPRLEREQALLKAITGIINRGGRVLMPVFALGRAQELLLILDEYWGRHPELQKIPIYYASNLARRCMLVYQTYVGAMNDNIKRLFRERLAEASAEGDRPGTGGPWDFRYIRSLKNLERFNDVGGCVMLAAPGMMQSGVSRELLERWAPNEKNGVIVTGYSVEGTMARQLLQEPDTIQAVTSKGISSAGRRGPGASDADRPTIPRRCSVQEFSFAAHVDGTENREFIEEINAPVVILVHGEQHAMTRLKSKLLSLNVAKAIKVKVFTPRNCEELKIPFKVDKTAKVVGRLAAALAAPTAATSPADGADGPILTGVLVQNDFKFSLMAADDLREYAGLNTTTITCRQHLRLASASLDLLRWALEGVFGRIEELPQMRRAHPGPESNGTAITAAVGDEVAPLEAAYLIMGCVRLFYYADRRVELEWEGNQINDGIADSVMAVLFNTETSPAAVKRSTSTTHSHTPPPPQPHTLPDAHARLEAFLMFLRTQFGHDAVSLLAPPSAAAADEDHDSGVESDGGNERQGDHEVADSNGDAKGKDKEDGGGGGGQNRRKTTRPDAARSAEQERLRRLGVPVAGVAVRVDKMEARVWLEDLEVECTNRVFADRVRAVVERACEVTAPLWA